MDIRHVAALGGASAGPTPVSDIWKIRANFCGHDDHLGRVVFDPVYFCANEVTAADRNVTYQIKRAMGLTHLVLQVPDGNAYGESGMTIPDWRQRMDLFKTLVDEVLAAGFHPVIFLTTGNDLAALGLDDGELRRKARVFAGYGQKAWFTGGWEITGSQSPTVSTYDVNRMLKILHEELGDGALLFVHGADAERCTAASYRGGDPDHQPPGCHWKDGSGWVEDTDPSNGDEIGWWYTPEALYCLAWFWQSRHGGDGPSFNDDTALKAWRGRAIECQIRFLSPAHRSARMAATEPNAPDWMGSRDHVRPIYCVFELEPYEYIRRQCDAARVQAVADFLLADGFEHFGSGVAR